MAEKVRNWLSIALLAVIAWELHGINYALSFQGAETIFGRAPLASIAFDLSDLSGDLAGVESALDRLRD